MNAPPPPVQFLEIPAGTPLEARRLAPAQQRTGDPRTLVFLHEGLGCIALWRSFPQVLCDALGLPGLVYSRAGYGQSAALRTPRAPDFMHREALETLPEVLRHFALAAPVLVGHSDGGSIALLHAALQARRPAGTPAAHAVVALAPHLFVEDLTVDAIARIAADFETSALPERLARYHRDARATFRGWADIWLDARFRHWNIEAEVERIDCPVLALQGEQDEYGTMAQVQQLAARCPSARWVAIPDCRHSPHLDQPARVIDEIARFLGVGATP